MNYYEKENWINARFMNAGETYHLCSPENFDIIFVTEDDFKAGMSLMGLCAKLYPEVKIFTFELMSNHVHILTAGEEKRSLCFFDEYKKALERHFKDSNRVIHWKDFTCNSIRVDTVENFRNVTAYINRNGFVVHPDSTPFSYEWGANRFFFNPEAKSRHRSNWTSMTQKARQSISRSRKFDFVEGLYVIDGYVSPLCFCDIERGEAIFRDARQYFNKISKNIESMKDVAASIGESVYYTDDDLFNITVKLSQDQFGETRPSFLDKDAKLRLARTLHYDFNASNKQIQRILHLDGYIVNGLFPKTH